jgi:hypothetical protein
MDQLGTVVFTRADGFFDDLLVNLTNNQALAHSFVLYIQGAERPWFDFETAVYSAHQSDVEFEWSPAPAMRMVFSQLQPPINEIKMVQRVRKPAYLMGKRIPNRNYLGPLEQRYSSLDRQLVISYFERHQDEIRQKFGGQKHWPAVWQFGRVVRNAAAHDGALYFAGHTNQISVSWKGLEYTSADQGRIIFNRDLGLADLILLLIEMDSFRRD